MRVRELRKKIVVNEGSGLYSLQSLINYFVASYYWSKDSISFKQKTLRQPGLDRILYLIKYHSPLSQIIAPLAHFRTTRTFTIQDRCKRVLDYIVYFCDENSLKLALSGSNSYIMLVNNTPIKQAVLTSKSKAFILSLDSNYYNRSS